MAGVDRHRRERSVAPTPSGLEQQWLLQYLPLVKRIASQLALQASVVFDRQDMEQVGLVGLLDCLRRYGEPDAQFASFATQRIRGAILDELRHLDWRPRGVRQQAHHVRDVLRDLHRRLGREPTQDETLAGTGLTAAQYQEYVQAQAGEAVESLDNLLQKHAEPWLSLEGNPEAMVVEERTLSQALAHLNERERLILTLYYQHELNLKEIGLVLDLSEARVCQLYKRAIARASNYVARTT